MRSFLRATALFTLLAGTGASAQVSSSATEDSLARAVLKELIEINTAPSGGAMSTATRAMAARLMAAGFDEGDVQLAGPDAAHQNLVATLRGRDRDAKPVLLLAHIDVVEALASDWSMDPFTLHELDGYFYGRGTTDNKGGAAVIIANMLRWKRERFVPSRDVIAVLTTDEETTAEAGIQWLLANVPRLKAAEYALNTDAGGMLAGKGSEPPRFFVQSSEKMYQTFRLEVSNRGGHSSLPRADNAIYALARALAKVEAFHFPVMYNEVTRVSFARSATLAKGQVAADLRALAGGARSGPCRRPDVARTRHQRQPPHDLRRDDALRRSRRERPPATGDRDCELPDLPGGERAGGAGDARAGGRRHLGPLLDRRRQHAESGLTPSSGCDGGGRVGVARDLASRRLDPGHGERRDRRALPAQPERPGVRGLGAAV
ncbi:MAG: M20/M25/M40 family metallo-hydrolase [Gemmatimonadetes bacterium]|nr:M20/M25/M40 family metallo-hydrolase [Gemmatimonadota bacterium]